MKLWRGESHGTNHVREREREVNREQGHVAERNETVLSAEGSVRQCLMFMTVRRCMLILQTETSSTMPLK